MKNNKKIELVIVLLSIISCIFCITKNFSNEGSYENIDFWIISLLFAILNTIFFIFIKKTNSTFFLKTIEIVSFIKYSALVFLYYFERQNLQLYNKGLVLYLMCSELIAIYITLIIFYCRKNSNEKDISEVSNSNTNKSNKEHKLWGISLIIGIFCTLIIIMKQPRLLIAFFSINDNIKSNLTGFEYLIYKTTFIILLISILKFILEKINSKYSKTKVIISLAFILYFSLNISASFSGNISRWTLLINLLIFSYILNIYYPSQKKFLKGIIISFLIIFLPLATFLKFDKDDEQETTFYNIANNALNVVSYRSFDAYFSGPYQISTALRTKEEFADKISFNTFLNDVFNNFPLINKILNKGDTVPTYYNYVYYWNHNIYDKICPMIGQGYIYLGTFLAPILSVIFIVFAIYADNKIFKESNEVKIYMLSYISIFFALNICLNLTIMFQSIWLEILPLYIVYKTNIKLK